MLFLTAFPILEEAMLVREARTGRAKLVREARLVGGKARSGVVWARSKLVGDSFGARSRRGSEGSFR